MSYSFIVLKFLGYSDGNEIERLADLATTGELKVFHSRSSNGKFEDRKYFKFYTEDSSARHEGTLAIWEAKITPNTKDPDKDYVNYKHFLSSIRPVLMQVVRENFSEALNFLKSERFTKAWEQTSGKTGAAVFFSFDTDKGPRKGVLIHPKMVNPENGSFSPGEESFLPVYSDDKVPMPLVYQGHQLNLWPLTSATMSAPIGKLLLKSLEEGIIASIANNSSWKQFQELCPTGTHTEHNTYRALLTTLASSDMAESMKAAYGCSDSDYENACKKIASQADSLFEALDFTSEVAISLIMRNKAAFGKIIDPIEKKWKEQHAAEEKKWQVRLTSLETSCKTKEQKFADINEKAKEAQLALDKLLKDIEDAENLKSEAEQEARGRVEKLETLEKELKGNIASQLEEARGDFAKLLAKAPFLAAFGETLRPNSRPPAVPSVSGETRNTEKEPPQAPASQIPEVTEIPDWLDDVSDNLEAAGVSPALTNELAVFLAAAFTRGTPVVLAGPGARDIADAFSLATLGAPATLREAGTALKQSEKPSPAGVLLFQNSLEGGRLDRVITDRECAKRGAFIEIPFTEELSLLPFGLYNYALPICTELYLAEEPTRNYLQGKLSDGLQGQIGKLPVQAGRILSLNRFEIAGMASAKLNRFLGRAATLLSASFSKTSVFRLIALPAALLKGDIGLIDRALSEDASIADAALTKKLEEITSTLPGGDRA